MVATGVDGGGGWFVRCHAISSRISVSEATVAVPSEAYAPSRSIRRTSIPSARAPIASVPGVSPTCKARPAATSRPAQRVLEDAGVGLAGAGRRRAEHGLHLHAGAREHVGQAVVGVGHDGDRQIAFGRSTQQRRGVGVRPILDRVAEQFDRSAGVEVDAQLLQHDRGTLVVQRGEALGVAAEMTAVGVVGDLGGEGAVGVVQADLDVERSRPRPVQPLRRGIDGDQRAERVQQQRLVAAIRWSLAGAGARVQHRRQMLTAWAMRGPSVSHPPQRDRSATPAGSRPAASLVSGSVRTSLGSAPRPCSDRYTVGAVCLSSPVRPRSRPSPPAAAISCEASLPRRHERALVEIDLGGHQRPGRGAAYGRSRGGTRSATVRPCGPRPASRPTSS